MASNLEIKIKLLTEGIADLLKLKTEIGNVGATAEGLASDVQGATDALDDLGAAAAGASTGVEDTATATEGAATAMADARAAALSTAGGFQAIADVASEVASGLQDSANAAQEAADAANDAASEARDNATALKEQADAATEAATHLLEAAEGAKELATASGDINAIEAAAGLAQMAKTAVDAARGFQEDALAADTAAIALEDAAKAARDTALSLQSIAGDSQETATGLQDVASGANEAALGTQTIGTRFGMLMSTMGEMGTSLRAIINGHSDLAAGMIGSARASDSLISKLKSIALEGGGAGSAAKEAALGVGLLGPEAAIAEKAADTLSSGIKLLAGGLLAIAGIKVSFDYLKDAAKYAGEVQTLGITLGVVASNAGYSGEEMAKYEESLKKMGISTESARQSMVQMIQSGLPLGPMLKDGSDNVTALARAAQDLAVVTGQNSSDTLQKLITNIAQMDTMGLRFMGITLDAQTAYDKFGIAVGKTASALTDAQKKQAVNNEVLAQATKLAGAYEISLNSVGKQVSSMKRYTEELSLAIGTKLLPAYAEIVKASTDMLKVLQKEAEAYDKSGQAGAHFGDAMKLAMAPIAGFIEGIWKWTLQLVESMAPGFESIISVVSDAAEVVREFLGALMDGGGMAVVQAAIVVLNGAFAALADGVKIVRLVFEGFIGVFALGAKSIIDSALLLSSALPDGPWKDKLKAMSGDLDKLRESSTKNIVKITEDFMDGETQLGSWVKELGLGNAELKKLNATPAALVKDEIRQLVRAQNDGTKSSVEIATASKALEGKMLALKDSGVLTGKAFDTLSVKLSQVGKVMNDELNAAFGKLKTSSDELKTGISGASGTIISALRTVAENGIATAGQFEKAFGKNLGIAKNIQELQSMSDVLVTAKGRWPEAAVALNAELAQVGKRFDEIYQKQLDNLKTTAEWGTLRAAIVKMGADGAISQNELNVALAKGEEAVRKLDPAYIAVAKASNSVVASTKGVDKQMGILEGTITRVASQAESAYTRMAEGYGKLGAIVESSAQDQVDAIDKRYSHESALLDSSLTGAGNIEKQKTALLIASIQEKLDIIKSSYDKQQAYVAKQVDAETKALDAKMEGYKTDELRIAESLGKQADKHDEYQAALSDLDKKRRNAVATHEIRVQELKVASLGKMKDAYQSHIDKLVGEEERLLGKIKDFAQQAEQAKLSAEEKIRGFQKSGMTDYEAYEATKTDITKAQSNARDALSKGDFELARTYLSQAKGMAGELNKEVKDGENVLVSKKQAIENATNATKGNLDVELELNKVQKTGAEAQLSAVQQQIKATEQMRDAVLDMISALKEAMGQKLELNIRANTEEATKKIQDLQDLASKKESLMPVKVDLDAANVALKKMMDDIAAGKPFKVDADVSSAEAALKKLGESTTDVKVKADVSEALASIETAKNAVEKAGGTPIKVNTDTSSVKAAAGEIQALGSIKVGTVSVNTDYSGVVNAKVELGKLKDATGTPIRTTVDVNRDAVGKAHSAIILLSDAAGKKIYTNISTNTKGLDEATAKIEALHNNGRKEIIAHVRVDGTAEITGAGDKWNTTKGKIENSPAKAKVDVSQEDINKAEAAWGVSATKIEERKATAEVKAVGVRETKADIDKILQNLENISKTQAAANITSNAKASHPDLEYAKKLLDDVNKTSSAKVEVQVTGADKLAPLNSINSEPVTKDVTIKVNSEELGQLGEIDVSQVNKPVYVSVGGIEETSNAIQGVADATYTADITVETDVEPVQTELSDLEEPLTTTVEVDSNAEEEKTNLDATLEDPLTAPLEIKDNASEIQGKIDALKSDTDSDHTISADDSAVLEAKKAARKPTYSTHYIISSGGFFGGGFGLFADGGPVQVKPLGFGKGAPLLTEGTIPGAGNHDSVPRTLEAGSFVLKKSAVERHGAGRLLDMMTKAKSTPRQENMSVVGRINALLMPGEIVVGKDTVSRVGVHNLHRLNRTGERQTSKIPSLPLRFADGGSVGAGFDFVAPQISLGNMGFAFEDGGSVPAAPAPQVTQIDLRGNNSRATVTAADDQSKNLLNVLSELKARAS